nr:hypothetical protein [Ruminococcus sp.]
MHQNRHITNKVGVEILNLKVINQYTLIKLFNLRTENNRCRTVKVIDFIALNEISCSSPALTYNVERVICSGINISLISVKVENFINRMNIDL